VSIDAGFGFIRIWQATNAALYEGAVLRQDLLDKTNMSRKVCADTAYRSKVNVEFMEDNGFVSYIHCKKPKGKPMSETARRAHNLKSKVRSHVEHVFAEQKTRMGLFIRTVGIARATTKIGLANLVFNFRRLTGEASRNGYIIECNHFLNLSVDPLRSKMYLMLDELLERCGMQFYGCGCHHPAR